MDAPLVVQINNRTPILPSYGCLIPVASMVWEIISGRTDAERVHRIVAFTGQSLTIPRGATALMKLSSGNLRMSCGKITVVADNARRSFADRDQIEHNCLLSASVVEEIDLDDALDIFAR